jgi:hypothetical protein
MRTWKNFCDPHGFVESFHVESFPNQWMQGSIVKTKERQRFNRAVEHNMAPVGEMSSRGI